MGSEELKERVKQISVEVDGELKVACANALQLARELGLAPKEVGECCNELNIKISGCQLGCFN